MKLIRWTVPAALVAAAAAAAVPSSATAAVRVSAPAVATPLSATPTPATITVRNTGPRRVRGLVVTVVAAKGVSIAGAPRGTFRRAVGSLSARTSRRVTINLTTTAATPPAGALPVRVIRRGNVVARTTLAYGGAAATPPANPNTLEGRYFWGSRYSINGIVQNSLYFTGPNLVYTGDPETAWPTCAAIDEKCKPYTYDAKANQLVIDGKPAVLNGRKLEYDGDSHLELGSPAPGTRWDTVVTYSNSSGLCPLYCSYFTERLTFLPDGTFVRGAVASGTGPVVDYASVPADRRGTYEVRADRTLRLAFADGKERIETVAVYLNDDGSRQSAGEGIVLNGDGYFDIRD